MSVYIYSTLTSAQRYKTKNGVVEINGGANLATRRTLDTPRGVVTEITEEQYKALLEDSLSFSNHIKNGFVTSDEKKADANDVAKNLNPKDKSAQKTAAELKDRSSDKELSEVSTGKK